MAKRQRCIIVQGNGRTYIASGEISQTYDLDKAFQQGAKVVGEPIPIGLHAGTSILLIIEEEAVKE